MGRKVHPVGFRVGVIRDWQAKWYADQNYVQCLQEDLKLRRAIRSKYADAGISLVEIDRQGDKILVNIFTSRPGVVIGRGGQRVDEMRRYLEDLIGSRVQLNIQEVRQPELDAYLVALTVAEQIGRRVAYRRAMKQAIARTIEAGAKGVRINCAGRLAGAEIARREMLHQGQVPLHKLRADIDYGFTEAHTTLGRIGVKVWIYKGDILPEAVEEVEEMPEAVIAEEPEVAEVAPAAPPAEAAVPSEPAEAVTEEIPSATVTEEVATTEVASEPAAEVPAEAAPEAVVEKAAAKPRTRKKKVEAEATSEPAAEVPTEAVPEAVVEEAAAKPRTRKKKAEATSEPAAEVTTEAVPEAVTEETTAKPRARKKKAETKEDSAAEVKETDATTEAS